MYHLTIDPLRPEPPIRQDVRDHSFPDSLPQAKEIKVHPSASGEENASIFFVGTATTVLEWEGIRLLTDPNFLHAGDHVHLGPGVTAKRLTNPAFSLFELPRIDVVLLSHYHADHFDQEVEASLRRSLPIITTPHAKRCLTSKGPTESFTQVWALDFFQSMMVDIVSDPGSGKKPALKVTGMPGSHVPPGILSAANEVLKAVPPTNGWMLELGYTDNEKSEESFSCGYRIYISGDTLFIDELKQIPDRYRDRNIDLMLIHLGGTTIPGPSMPLLMVTMDANQGVKLMRLINPDLTIPIHYDDYDVFLSSLQDFRKEVEAAGLADKVVYLDRKDQFQFHVKT